MKSDTTTNRTERMQEIMGIRFQTTYPLQYDGRVIEIYGIWLLNILLNILTLGLYSFWGRTRLRRYIWSCFSLLGDRFTYTGTGKELLIGFLKALPVIILLYTPFFLLNANSHPWITLLLFLLWFFIYAGLFAAMRYRFSRTTWRGIRGRLTGSAFGYACLVFFCLFLNCITLGFLIPYSDIKIRKYLIGNMHIGSLKAEFSGKSSPLIGINILILLLAIPTLGLSRFWYNARLQRHSYASTTLGSLTFEGKQTGWNLMCLVLGNLLILLFTLGLGMPFLVQRKMRYFASTLIITGDPAMEIAQSAEKLGTSGEGLEGLLGDHDIGFM